MRLSVSTYVEGSSRIHRFDARAKILLLIEYTVTLFLVDTWAGMLVCLVCLALTIAVSGVGARSFTPALALSGVLAALAVIFNAFAIDVAASSQQPIALGIAGLDPVGPYPNVPLIGAFGLSTAGLARGCFFGLRIIALVLASLVVSFTTTSTALTQAFASFLRPLRRLRVPVDDAAMVLSIAIRFIPVLIGEFGRIRDAQWSRGAAFGEGSAVRRLRAWAAVFVPLFVSVFRRADALALAMDARCYGVPGIARTSLSSSRLGAPAACALVVGIAACVAACVYL